MTEEIVKFGDKTYQFIWIPGGDIPQEGVSQMSGSKGKTILGFEDESIIERKSKDAILATKHVPVIISSNERPQTIF